ncbi:hypothetical protein AMS68_007133 [Peltaster fructicola]|uniref:glucan 1,3-beta-glucosidase n=1 Tax=Peltaster fructicola TaxID=286661 RepID=A0A6H0Y3T5_9PEZI|nr:hypothetical protein AMS68_007133 [Peltaster fructicola]
MPSGSQHPRDSPARRQRRRRTHQRIDSYGQVPERRQPDNDSEDDFIRSSPGRRRRESHRKDRGHRITPSSPSKSGSSGVSTAQLAQLDQLNQKLGWDAYDEARPQRQREARDDRTTAETEADRERERRRREHKERRRRRHEEEEKARAADSVPPAKIRDSTNERRESRRTSAGKTRVVSGQALERQSHYYDEKESYREDARLRYSSTDSGSADVTPGRRLPWRKIIIGVAVVVIALIIIIPVAVVVSKKNAASSDSSGSTSSSSSGGKPSNGNLAGISQSSIPQSAQGTWLDPFSWYDTTDFNVTYTADTVGGLPIMGLNRTWDDSTQANSQVLPLNQSWAYGKTPIHGINLGGWLSIEPFITPSLFSGYTTRDGVVDEYTLSAKLGASKAKSTIEQHYSSFVNEQTFVDIQAAGFDHVRIPFSYWAITSYDNDPYVSQVGWRYLLRAIEWARKYGLRINLDLHGAPGSQNGWNHSGRQGTIGWLNGTDGALNGQRTIDIHKQLSTFFTQPRYKNIVTMYGLVNEPRMTSLDQSTVITWSQNAINAIRSNNYTGIIIFGDGFMGLDNWQGKLQNNNNLLLDVHQYVIFNVNQLVLNHHDKINFACKGWTQQALRSENTQTGFGPTLCGEWSQADTDCATYLNNVGVGSRWEGTLNMAMGLGGGGSGSVLSPTCPTKNNPQCSCSGANADPSTYSDVYKQWLLMFAEAQMHSFEQGWGWFYWTWQTETASQWSYKAGLAAGILPKLAYQRAFDCSQNIPDFASLGLAENY